jgi:hypothetical protein
MVKKRIQVPQAARLRYKSSVIFRICNSRLPLLGHSTQRLLVHIDRKTIIYQSKGSVHKMRLSRVRQEVSS